MEYRNVNFSQVYSEDPTANLSNSFQYTNQGLQYTQQMLAQNQKVEIQEAGADYRFAGSVLETVAPFLQKKLQDNIDKRVTDGLAAYKSTLSESKTKAIENWKANINELELEGQALEDAGDRWWEENKEDIYANDVRKSFQKQGWGYAYGFKKGELIDKAHTYNLDVPSIKMANDGVDFNAAMAKEQRQFLSSLGNISHEMFGAIVEPIMNETEKAAFKNWKSKNTKDMLATDQAHQLKKFHDSIRLGENLGTAWTDLVRRSKVLVGGNTTAAKEYAYNVVMSGIDNESINRDTFNKLGLSTTENLSDGTKGITVRKIIGEQKWSGLKTVLREKEKKAWQAEKDADKISSYNDESTELEKYQASDDGTPAQLELTKNNLRNSIIEHNKNHSYKPDRLMEELAQLELEDEIGKDKMIDRYTALYDSGKLTVEDIENAPNFIANDKKWQDKALQTDTAARDDKLLIDENYTGFAGNTWQVKGKSRVSPLTGRIDRGLTEKFKSILKAKRQGGELKENETIEKFNIRTRQEAKAEMDNYIKTFIPRGKRIQEAAALFEGGKDSHINKNVSASEEARDTINQIIRFQDAGAGDISNWTPDELFGEDHNGVISGTRVQRALDQNMSEAGRSVLGRAGPNIGGRLKVTQDFQKDPLIQLIADTTDDSYWGALNKLAVAFNKTPIKLPNSINTAESLPPEQLKQLQKGLKFNNPYQIDRAWGEGNIGVGWEESITPYQVDIKNAAEANSLTNESEIAAWTEIIEENPFLMNDETKYSYAELLEYIQIDARRKQFKFEKDPQKKQEALNGTILNGITQ